MNIYTVEAILKGYNTIPDYNCPPGWYGSGVYDKEVPCSVEITAEVLAETQDRAEQIVIDYDYDSDSRNEYLTVEDVEVKAIYHDGEDEDYEKEFIEVSYGGYVSDGEPPEFDPDEYYDRRRDDRGTGDD